jgi:hypothetical protein
MVWKLDRYLDEENLKTRLDSKMNSCDWGGDKASSVGRAPRFQEFPTSLLKNAVSLSKMINSCRQTLKVPEIGNKNRKIVKHLYKGLISRDTNKT